MPDRADTSIVSALAKARSVLLESAMSAEQRRLIGPAVAEIDRIIASVRPAAGTSFELTPVAATAPPHEQEIEALRREVERLRVLAQHERGLVHAILQNSPHGIIVSDPRGKLILQNRASERIWAGSATADSVAQWGQYRAYHADGRPYEPGDWSMARCLSSRAVISAEEVHFQRFDGTHGMLLGSCAPIFSADGELLGAVSIFADITEFKQLEASRLLISEASRKLALSGLDYEATLRSVADLAAPHVADGAIVDILETDGAVARLAAVHLEPLGSDAAEALCRRYPVEPDVPRAVHAVLRTGESILWPDLQDRERGSWPEVASLSPAFVPGEEDRALLALLRDLGVRSAMIVPLRARGRTRGAITLLSTEPGRHYTTDDLTLAEELSSFAALALDNAQLYREAQQVNRAKDEFLATLSHELRTPLTAILGWTRMLRQGSLKPETQVRALEAIERNGALQAQLVEDLLDASRIITGKLRLEVTPLDLPPVVHGAIDAVRHGADAKHIDIQVALDPAAGPISGDPTRLQQVVWNLLSNAIKFTPRGGQVQVQLTRVGSVARLEVRDSGQGISAEFLPFVFDRFRQADSTSTRPHSGLGLGLAIARHLVELHGGVVRAESPGEGQGAVFTVELPIAVGARALRKLDDAASLLDTEPTLQGLHILVVDDEPDARELVGAVLERKGATVTTAATVTDALAAIEQARPDVILSDLGMPGEDGYSLIRRLRSRSPERGGRIPAAALTAYASAQDRTRALLAGFQSHVPKPIEASELAAVIANLAGRTG